MIETADRNRPVPIGRQSNTCPISGRQRRAKKPIETLMQINQTALGRVAEWGVGVRWGWGGARWRPMATLLTRRRANPQPRVALATRFVSNFLFSSGQLPSFFFHFFLAPFHPPPGVCVCVWVCHVLRFVCLFAFVIKRAPLNGSAHFISNPFRFN